MKNPVEFVREVRGEVAKVTWPTRRETMITTSMVFIFAVFYWKVGAMHRLEQALYYSASCYATLGDAAANFPNEWRLVGALEALIGFVLIGWSTAFMVRTLRKIID